MNLWKAIIFLLLEVTAMINLLFADFCRLKKSSAFFLCLLGMAILASAFMVMQATAMDYTVPLSRVVFLPLTFYGVAAAAFVSVFIGADFKDGFIRNKLLFTKNRSELVISHMIVSCAACALIYAVTIFYTWTTASFFFENDVEFDRLFQYFLLGIGMSCSVSCLFTVITVLCADQTHAVIWCMGISFGMLFLSLHTHQLLVQTPYRDGVRNPHYTDGFRRVLYGILHDLNPCGQAAQLTCWNVWNPLRAAFCSLLWVMGAALAGCTFFQKKDIK